MYKEQEKAGPSAMATTTTMIAIVWLRSWNIWLPLKLKKVFWKSCLKQRIAGDRAFQAWETLNVIIQKLNEMRRRMMNSDDETLSTEEDSLQCISSLSSDTTGRSSDTEIAETSETRRPGPPTIDTPIK